MDKTCENVSIPHLFPGYTWVMLPHSMTICLHPVQVAPSSSSQIILHTICEAVLIVHDAWGGLLVQVCLVHRGETSPHLRLYGNVYRLGLTNTLHIQPRPELTLLMEEYIKSLREVYSEACVQSSWILFLLTLDTLMSTLFAYHI